MAPANSFITCPQSQQKPARMCAHLWNTLYLWKRKYAQWFSFLFFFLVNEWTILMDCYICMPGFLTPSVGNKSQSSCRQIYSFSVLPFMSVSHPAQTHWSIVKILICMSSSARQRARKSFCLYSCLLWRHHPGNSKNKQHKTIRMFFPFDAPFGWNFFHAPDALRLAQASWDQPS